MHTTDQQTIHPIFDTDLLTSGATRAQEFGNRILAQITESGVKITPLIEIRLEEFLTTLQLFFEIRDTLKKEGMIMPEPTPRTTHPKKHPTIETDSNPTPETSPTTNREPETGNPKPETTNPGPPARDQEPETKDQQPKTRDEELETENSKPETGNRKPETTNPELETRDQQSLHSAIRNPQSAIALSRLHPLVPHLAKTGDRLRRASKDLEKFLDAAVPRRPNGKGLLEELDPLLDATEGILEESLGP
ncbi:MAG: hypothetical protein HY706_20690 [Candidatus Hydrogenedentes bacterium]|nr:hypothetical protein [Candidatus Hydrogenedentota bacterium]